MTSGFLRPSTASGRGLCGNDRETFPGKDWTIIVPNYEITCQKFDES